MTLIDLPFLNPIVNAAGTLGFNPVSRKMLLDGLGGFITNPISLSPRSPAAGTRLTRFSGGILIHTGYPNPGLKKVLQKHSHQWARSTLPVVVNLLSDNPDETYRMVRELEETEGVQALEVSLPPGAPKALAREILQSAVGELPVIAKVGLEDVLLLIDEVIDAGASALSMGPPRGRLPNSSGQTYSGRINGTAVFPQALELLQQIKNSAIQIIFAGGVQKQSQAELAMANGASGIQLDLMLWKNGGFSALKESS